MAANRLDAAKGAETPAEKQAAAPEVKSGGGKMWLPLIVNILLMPALAYGVTTFLLIPKLQGGHAASAEAKEGDGHGGGGNAKSKFTAPLGGKVLVNVAGTAGTRYLVSTMTLVGKSAEFQEHVAQNDPQLRDAAASILGGKTIGDLEKPGMRNIIRAELISAFNDILGKESVTDIYLTEFAIQ